MQRSAAAKVYVFIKIAELGNGGGEVEPTPPVTGSLACTMSSMQIKITKDFILTHAPVVDYWE